MRNVILDGVWQLTYFHEGEFAIAHPDALKDSGAPSVAAQVPGNVELDLQRAGVLPEPFYASNIRQLRQFEPYEWWYTREFTLPADLGDHRWHLVLEGLDTLGTIWINGHEVGQCQNMLVEHSWDVTDLLRPGEDNAIAVRIASALNHARRFHYDAVNVGPDHRYETLFVRKAPHVGGWDIMPRAVSAGIWRSVYLEARPHSAIEQIYYWTASLDANGATLGVNFQFRTDAPLVDGFSMHFHGVCGDHEFETTWPAEFIADRCWIHVPDPKLWWPKGYGDPNLYTVTAQLVHEGKIVDERVDRIGIRTLELKRTEVAGGSSGPNSPGPALQRFDEPPDPDSHFVFYVNHEPIMIKGANWVPLDAFHSRDASRVDEAVALFEDLGCNMIRCWGGNVYEDNHFFDLCDNDGILVWQDFAFACAIYPQTDDFLAQVREEAEKVVEKLRNHACLALWCGDNEIDGFYANLGLSPSHNRLTREVIPQVLQRRDPYRAYVPSSPYVPPSLEGKEGIWRQTPEQHLWGPRGYFKGSFYVQHSAHFIGEIGYHGCPNVASIRRFISPDSLWPWQFDDQPNDEWQVHAVYHWQHNAIDRDRIKLMANQVRELFGFIPDDLESFALASQISQAEAKKFFVESTRLRKWRTSGILWWNVIDGWPQFSDAIVDYYFGKKLAYHYLQRVQRPVAVIIGEPGADKYLPVVVSNDSLSPATVEYRIEDTDSHEVVASGSFSAPANQNWQVARLRTFASEQRLYLIHWQVDGIWFGNHYLVGHPPISFEDYRSWLEDIAALPTPFDAATVAK